MLLKAHQVQSSCMKSRIKGKAGTLEWLGYKSLDEVRDVSFASPEMRDFMERCGWDFETNSAGPSRATSNPPPGPRPSKELTDLPVNLRAFSWTRRNQNIGPPKTTSSSALQSDFLRRLLIIR